MPKHVIPDTKCTGCLACYNACPLNAISINADNRGFFIPFIDETKCVGCGKCSSVCNKEIKRTSNASTSQTGYIVFSKNKCGYKNGSSSGVFTTIALNFLNNKRSVVCGAAFIDGLVKHVLVFEKKDVYKLSGSKYVQSFIGDIYQKIEDLLKKDFDVLFSGTPCQVDGLKTYLNKDYKNLFTIDLICHGVPSPAFLKKDLEQYCDYKSITNISFRTKNLLFKSRSKFILTICGKKTIRHLPSRDVYYSMFLNNHSFRECCYKCRFSNLNRIGDITIGDCDSYMNYPDFHKNEATSTLLINNLHGKELWEHYSVFFDYCPMDINLEANKNTQLLFPSTKPDSSIISSIELNSMNLNALKQKYTKPSSFREKIAILFSLFLPGKRK